MPCGLDIKYCQHHDAEKDDRHHEHHDHDCACHCHDHCDDMPEHGLSSEQKIKLARIVCSALLLGVVQILSLGPLASSNAIDFSDANFIIKLILYAIAYLNVGYDILIRAIKNIMRGKVFDENFLMAVATIGAIALGFMGDGDFVEAVAVMLFYQLGEWFEGYAIGRSRKNITNLLDIRPDYANVEENGVLKRVSPDTLDVGSVIVVQPGEKIPLDGIVVEGSGALDTAALTGESVPKTVSTDDEVVSGCISLNGVLKIRTTKIFSDSTASKILELVENASEKKSQSENFITKFARVYTPIVCISAALLALVPPLILMTLGMSADWFTWAYRALTFLVISCPCALVISIPLSFFAGIGCASKNGILIKGSSYLEELAKMQIVAFDKTGTLTKGTFTVVETHVIDGSFVSESELVKLAAYAESSSTHPIAKSICAAYGSEIDHSKILDLHEISAQGVEATIEGKLVRVGKAEFVDSETSKIMPDLSKTAGSKVFISISGKMAGYFVISDVVKETSREAISQIRKLGIEKTVMLTGDNEQTAKDIAKELNIDEFHANLLPENKVEQVERLSDQGLCAFVGDGINDAPVLMRSDIGIAMGALGSDAAIEAADVVLMDDDPMGISRSISIARRCLNIVHQNIVFAIGIKVLFLLLGAFGLVNMYAAIFADVGVMVLAVLNAMRCLKY